jgi:hypothetical protein
MAFLVSHCLTFANKGGMETQNLDVRLTLRISGKLATWLREKAAKDKRTVSSMARIELEESMVRELDTTSSRGA